MNDTEIRERLFDLAGDAPRSYGAPPQLVRRARRRAALTLTSSIVVIVGLLLAGVTGIRALGSADGNSTLGGDPSAEPSEDAFANVHGWIAYRGGSDIVAVDPANPGNSVSLGPSYGGEPIGWSPDGTQLLLASDVQSGVTYGDLLVVHADGSKTDLFPGLFAEPNGGTAHIGSGGGSFSPDGTVITTAMGGDRGGVYVIDAEVSSRRLVVEADIYGPCEQFATWSPDGSQIAFIDFDGPYGVTCHRSPYGVSFVNPDGTGLQEQLVHLPLGLGPAGIAWSPDGSQLVIWGTFEGSDPREGMYVVNADGSDLRQISFGADDRWPSWSPDGTRIAFVRGDQLYTMAPDGTDVQAVEGVSPEGAIAWNPIG